MIQTPHEIAAQIITDCGLRGNWIMLREAIASALSEAREEGLTKDYMQAELDEARRLRDAAEQARDEALRSYNFLAEHRADAALDAAAIDRLQHDEAVVKLGEMLEGLSFWPNPTADQNLARDAGRVLLGKPAQRSNLDELFRLWHGPVLPLLKRAEAAEARLSELEAALSEARHQRDEAIQARDFTDSEMVQLWRDLTALAATWRAKGDSEHHAWRSGADEKYRWRSSTLAQCASELEAAVSVPAVATPSESGKADPSRILFAKKELEVQQPPETPRDETP